MRRSVPVLVALCTTLVGMRRALAAVACLLSLSFLAGQDKPYQEGDVDAFLADARSEGRPAIVLFNFNAKSG